MSVLEAIHSRRSVRRYLDLPIEFEKVGRVLDAGRMAPSAGNLQDWKELYRSIASTGIVLYGPYETRELPSGTKHYIIVFWDGVGRNRGAFLNKLYGFTVKGKHYPGLLLKFGGRKLGKSCIMLPVEYKGDLFRLVRTHEVNAKTFEVFG